MLLVNAADQATATAVAKIANPLMLHLPTHGMDYLPSLAFASSPAEVERGAAYEFVLNHVVDSITPTGMFRIEVPESHPCLSQRHTGPRPSRTSPSRSGPRTPVRSG